MSFLSRRIKNSKKNAGEGGQSPASTDRGASISVSVPHKPSAAQTTRASTVAPGGSMFDGMNFGEGASGTSEPAEKAGDASASGASSSGQILDGPSTKEGGDASAAEESGFSFIKDEGPAPASMRDREDGDGEPASATESPFGFLTASAPVSSMPAETQDSVGSGSSKPPQGAQETPDAAGDQPTGQRKSSLSALADQALVAGPPEARVPTSGSPTLAQVTPRKKKRAKATRPGHGRSDAAEATMSPAKASPGISRSNTSSREDVSQLPGSLRAQESPGSGERREGAAPPSTGPGVADDGVSALRNSPAVARHVVDGASTDAGTAHEPTVEPSASTVESAASTEEPAVSTVEPAASTVESAASTVESAATHPVELAPSCSHADTPVSTEEQGAVSEPGSRADAADESERPAKGGDEEAAGPSHQPDATVGEALTQAADGGPSIVDISEVEETPVVTLPTALSTPATQGEAEVTSVYDIRLNVAEQLDLRLQSEAFPLKSIESNLKSTEDQVIAILSSQRVKQSRRLSKRCAAMELRKLQASAISQENYEEAEQLNAKLKDASDQLTAISFALPSAEKMVSLSCERADLILSRCTVQRDSVACIELLLKEQHDEADAHQRRSAADLARQRQETSAQREALVRDQSHMDVDWDLSRRRTEKLQDEEQGKTKEFKEKRDVLCSQLELVNDEIAELEERLMGLRKKAAGLNSDIESEDCKIATVRLEMAEQRLSLSEQTESLRSQQDQLDKREAELEAAERKTEECAHATETRQNKFKDVAFQMTKLIADRVQALESNCDDTESIKSFIALAEQRRQSMASSASLTGRKNALTEKQAETDAVTRKLVVSQKKTASLRKKLDSVASQALDIEAAKKLAVSGRNFKEAQRLKQDQDLLASEQSGLTLALDEEVQKCTEFDPLVKNLQEQLDTLRQDYLQAEDESDMETVSDFDAYTDYLKQMLSSDTPSEFLSLLITTELAFCKTVCAELLVKHGKPVDLTGLLLEDDEDGTGADIGESTPVLEQQPVAQPVAASDVEQRKPLETQIAALEDELQAAIDEEEYDKADETNIELTALRSQLAALS